MAFFKSRSGEGEHLFASQDQPRGRSIMSSSGEEIDPELGGGAGGMSRPEFFKRLETGQAEEVPKNLTSMVEVTREREPKQEVVLRFGPEGYEHLKASYYGDKHGGTTYGADEVLDDGFLINSYQLKEFLKDVLARGQFVDNYRNEKDTKEFTFRGDFAKGQLVVERTTGSTKTVVGSFPLGQHAQAFVEPSALKACLDEINKNLPLSVEVTVPPAAPKEARTMGVFNSLVAREEKLNQYNTTFRKEIENLRSQNPWDVLQRSLRLQEQINTEKDDNSGIPSWNKQNLDIVKQEIRLREGEAGAENLPFKAFDGVSSEMIQYLRLGIQGIYTRIDELKAEKETLPDWQSYEDMTRTKYDADHDLVVAHQALRELLKLDAQPNSPLSPALARELGLNVFQPRRDS